MQRLNNKPIRYPDERQAEMMRRLRLRLELRDPQHEPHDFVGTAVLAARLANA